MASKHQSANPPIFRQKSFAGPTKIERIPQPSKFAPGPGWYDLNATYMNSKIIGTNSRLG